MILLNNTLIWLWLVNTFFICKIVHLATRDKNEVLPDRIGIEQNPFGCGVNDIFTTLHNKINMK
jgi:hypothetical protein